MEFVNVNILLYMYEKLSKVLNFNLPTGGGFAGGFIMGLRG